MALLVSSTILLRSHEFNFHIEFLWENGQLYLPQSIVSFFFCPQPNRLFNVAHSCLPTFTSCREETHHHPGILILCLGIQSNDLGSSRKGRHRIIVSTTDGRGHWVYPKEAATAVGLAGGLADFKESLAVDTGAFVWGRLTVGDPWRAFEHTSNLGHVSYGCSLWTHLVLGGWTSLIFGGWVSLDC